MIRFGTSARKEMRCGTAVSIANPSTANTANSRISRKCDSVLGLVVKMRRRVGQDHHLFELAEIDRRRDPYAEEKSRPFAMHALDRPDQQAARENPIEARGYDRVVDA